MCFNAATVRRSSSFLVIVPVLLLAATAVAVAALWGATATGATAALPAPRFVEEAAAAGLAHAYDGEFTFFVGGGVATFDCDDDGLPDLYLAGGSGPAALFRNASAVGGELRFARIPSPETDLAQVTGAYPLDVDGDAHTDLVVLRIGENVLLRGRGGCRFERANEALGLDGGEAWTTAFSAAWESPDALPTLAFGNYLTLASVEARTYRCDENALVRPTEGGRTYGAPAPLTPGWCPLSMLFSDWDRSGRRDLRASNDRHYNRDGIEQLWRMQPGAAPRSWTKDDGWQPMRLFGMGIASRDLTADGYPEVYLTNQADNKLQTLAEGPGRPHFRDIAIERRATVHHPFTGGDPLPSTAWHAQFEDVNNDGYVDLFVAKGNVEAQSEYAMRDPSNLLIGQADGTFREGAEAAGIIDYRRARGAALVDLNLDGRLDLVVVHRRENVSLFRNLGVPDGTDAAAGHWLAMWPIQAGANRDAIGAWVEVRANGRTWLVERTVGGGHVSGQLGPIHVGLGTADDAEVRVIWPDGTVGDWQPAAVDGWVIVDRAAGIRAWTPGEAAP
jgi:hypothetical protein